MEVRIGVYWIDLKVFIEMSERYVGSICESIAQWDCFRV